MALCTALCGCLVTDPITFNDEPDLPPSILSKPGFVPKIGDHAWIDKSKTPSWMMQVQVRDENVNQPLEGHWRIVHEDDMQPRFEIVTVQIGAAPGADPAVRELEFTVPSESLRDGECHRLELAVSSSFFRSTQRQFFDMVPVGRESDVAYASWWIWEGPGEAQITEADAALIVDTCNAIEALTMPAATREPEDM